MTFSEWIPGVDPTPRVDDAGQLGRALRDLHDALAAYDGDLANMSDLGNDIERLHSLLRAADDEEAGIIRSLHDRLQMLKDEVFTSALPAQALHGDISLGNQLRTPRGRFWNDFEDTFRGPIHWDVASCVISLTNHGATSDHVRKMLDGFDGTTPTTSGLSFAPTPSTTRYGACTTDSEGATQRSDLSDC
ncbi:hypothetical protein DSM112329_02821 [Paraconexibacter sp. AEG42_29]|uniref:Aminoglycoside phosphotransferase domain-containing protein n=2 Tax=Paraconexibacter sp. AEG42_29 TaxID=2997339 RepID=A0AAU7AW93_9ACTN